MADEKAPAEGAEAAAPAGPKMIMGLPLLTLIFAVLNVAVMGGGLYYVIFVNLLYKKPAITDEQVVNEIKKKEESKKKLLDENGYFTENYAETVITLRSEQGGKPHYATVELSLVCGSENCISQLKGNKAKVEDVFQTAIGSRSYTELSSLDVKFRMKHEILSRINSILKDTAVTDVLFTNFLVQ